MDIKKLIFAVVEEFINSILIKENIYKDLTLGYRDDTG